MENRTLCRTNVWFIIDVNFVRYQLEYWKIKPRNSYLELTWMVKVVKICFHLNGVIEILQELPLKRNDFLYITEEGIYLSIREESLTFQGLQIIFQQII